MNLSPAGWLTLLLLSSACTRASPAPRATQTTSVTQPDSAAASEEDPRRFEAEIRAFEANDRVKPPPPHGIEFVGSSSIKNWTTVAADFARLPVFNRGFGGSTLPDVVYYMDRIVLPYHPRLVVLYAGDNDLPLGRPPDRLLAEYQSFATQLHSREPAARLIYISIKPSPSRRQYLERAREANRAIKTAIGRDSLATFVDVFTPMLRTDGQPRPELFLADSLHMTRAGYLLWRRLLNPHLH